MDWRRSCGTANVNYAADGSAPGKIRWYFADPGAKRFPYPHAFPSEIWDFVHWDNSPVGEDSTFTQGWANGQHVGRMTGQHFCGKAEWFLNGQPTGTPPLPRNGSGVTPCCHRWSGWIEGGSFLYDKRKIPPPPPPQVAAFNLWTWAFIPGGTQSVTLSVTSGPNSGTVYLAPTTVLSPSSSIVTVNSYGYSIYKVRVNLPGGGITLAPGPYWVNLIDVTTVGNTFTYLDQSNGPSVATQTLTGAIPSETFQVLNGVSSVLWDNTNGFVNAFNVNGYLASSAFGVTVSNSFIV